jgi:hypothetical protein
VRIRTCHDWDHPLEMLFDDHCTAEVSRLLIEAAVTVRMLDDMAGHHVVGVNFTVVKLHCSNS